MGPAWAGHEGKHQGVGQPAPCLCEGVDGKQRGKGILRLWLESGSRSGITPPQPGSDSSLHAGSHESPQPSTPAGCQRYGGPRKLDPVAITAVQQAARQARLKRCGCWRLRLCCSQTQLLQQRGASTAQHPC